MATNEIQAKELAAAFVRHRMNRSKALRDCGYAPGYAKTSKAHKVFDRPEVQQEIRRILRSSDELADVEIAEIVEELRTIAFAGPDDGVTDANKLKGLELLGKFKAMFTDNVALETPGYRQLDANEEAEARAIARLRNLERLGGPEALPAADNQDPGGSGDGKTDPPLPPQGAGG